MSDTTTATPRLRPFGSKEYDQERLTLSLALQAILYREGIVDSPELPRWSDDMVLPELDEDAETMARKYTVSRRTPVAVLDPIEVPCLPLAELVLPALAHADRSGGEDWQMRNPTSPPTDAELAAMAEEVPY